MNTFVKLFGIASVVLLTACSVFTKEETNPPAALVEFKPAMAIKTIWSANVGDAEGFVFNPAYADNSIFSAAANGNIIRLDNATGREIWKIKAESELTAGVGVDSSTLAVVGEKGMLYTFDLNGKPRWQVQTSSEVLTTPAVGNGFVIVRSMNNQISAYDSLTGKRRWALERTLPPLILRTTPGMVIDSNLVFVGLPGGKLIAVALANGSVVWEATVGDPRGATELERIADVAGKPVLIGSEVCSAAYQGKVACFDKNTGSSRWAKSLSTNMGVAADERFVFAADEKGHVHAFSRNGGTNAWKNDKLGYRDLSSPISYGQAVAVGDMEGYIHFLSRENGTFIARTSTDGSAVVATPIVADTNVVFQTKDGKIVALAID